MSGTIIPRIMNSVPRRSIRNVFGRWPMPFMAALMGTANVQALLQHILDNMMNLARRVYSGELTDSDEARSHYFTLSLASVAPYLRMKDRRDAI